MIYTCTLNPSVDYQMGADNLTIGTLNRVEDTAFYPGGKGINVSRVLKNLGNDSVALGFVGGFTGDFITDSLKKAGIDTGFIIHDEPTRINVKVKSSNTETEINGSGAYISNELQTKLLKKLDQLTFDDYLIVSGSLPPSVSFTIYEEIAQIANEKGISLIIDIPDDCLIDLLKYRPFLIKPNEHELSAMLGVEINNKAEAIQGAKQLVRMGAVNVVVSLGEQGAILVNEREILRAQPPSGTLKSSVGAGDSLVAGFLASYIKDKDIPRAFQLGVASGTATAYSDNLCEKKEVENIFSQVNISNERGD